MLRALQARQHLACAAHFHEYEPSLRGKYESKSLS